ncbi:MAG: DUF805 domain-containing protein [Bradyrhizobium icense]|jgi:uncharacterized membrane protein YhaH (DUF805 family)|nr:MAG: DUF805 domain-containing protein [Bradyrhizobium icense]
MDWTWYLFGFTGRLTRAKYWLSGLVIVCLMLALVWLAYLTLMIDFVAHAVGTAHGKGKVSFGFGIDDIFLVFDPAAWRTLSLAKLPIVLVKASGLALFSWMFLATSIKRLHDRDRSGWWLVPFVAAPHLFNNFSDDLPGGYFMMAAGGIMFALMIWGFVELYCLRGTKWTNRFGPDPLGKEQIRQRSERARLRATTAWSQDSEIEMVPHKASPPPL